MKNIPLICTCAAAVLVAGLPVAHAASGGGPKARIFAKYDANKNGVIDGDEIAAVRKAYAADPKGEFARYDTDKDGKLSDQEIAQIKPPGAKKDGERKSGGGKKKADAEATPAQ